MKFATFLLAIGIGWIPDAMAQAESEPVPTADAMRAHLARRPESDTIHWKDPARGAALQVRILEVNGQAVKVQKTLASGLVTRMVALADLAGLSFALTPLERRLLSTPTAAAVPALRVLWDSRSAAIVMPDSQACEIGIALAKSLRLTGQPAALDEARGILDHIVSKDPAEHRKIIAKHELQTLEMTRARVVGPPEETDKVAWSITEADANAEAMLLATAWLADRHFSDLKRLEEEHPRWDEDDEVRPLRMRMYNLALDFALYPSLFHGTFREESADGLRKAWEVHRFTRSDDLARKALEDLAAWYPDTRAAKETAAEWARLKAQADAGNVAGQEDGAAGDGGDEADHDDDPSLPSPPPRPKRYNLFDD